MPLITPKLIKQPPSLKKRPVGLWLFIVACIVVVGLFIVKLTDNKHNTAVVSTATDVVETVIPSEQAIATRQLKNFTATEFVSLYNKYAYPNVKEFDISPPITGDQAADEKIRTLAVARGYIGRSIAIPPLTDTDNYQLQERAALAWHELSSAAKTDKHSISLTAAFRTIEDQRELFNNALYATGATKAAIAASKADTAVNGVLNRIAVPGYTRHHSGYTVDISCDSDPSVVFGASSCFTWLSKNNYENCKKYGWIPSYPKGASQQGPEPEEWEYSWVGFEAVSE
ncbi:D-alanyl-D-alanine carboxypeptidase family protein [Candidatus Saccharibacteria bacterium]|nr:D-alanyl-D-alanine carboxypeptidase family protein [Candidatus Saccharibacteria bacterium]